MKITYYIGALLCFIYIGCREQKVEQSFINTKISHADTIQTTDSVRSLQKITQKHYTLGHKNFNTILSVISDVKHTKGKHSDWMTNKAHSFYEKLFNMSRKDIIISTTSYTYKDNCKFYLHTLKNVSDTLSMQSYIKNAIGKRTGGYMGVRVLIFAMKDSLTANFIDIPPNYGYSKINNELIKTVYNHMDSVVLSCDSTKVCKFKDFSKR